MQEVNISKILQLCQVVLMIHNQTLCTIPEINFPSCEVIREIQEKLHLGKNNPLYSNLPQGGLEILRDCQHH